MALEAFLSGEEKRILLCSRPAFGEWFNYARQRIEARHGDVARAHLMSRLVPLGSLELVPADSTRSWRKSDWSKCKLHRPPLPQMHSPR